jgi:hypothetical protein
MVDLVIQLFTLKVVVGAAVKQGIKFFQVVMIGQEPTLDHQLIGILRMIMIMYSGLIPIKTNSLATGISLLSNTVMEEDTKAT